jgi:hypothetical protein
MTEQEWLDLEQEYRAVFGSNIPRMMLPADEAAALALIRKAIDTRDDGVFEQDIPADAAI